MAGDSDGGDGLHIYAGAIVNKLNDAGVKGHYSQGWLY